MQGNDQVQGYKDCPNCLIPDPTMVGSEENLWFLDALKRSISELTLLEKTWKGIKLFFFFVFFKFTVAPRVEKTEIFRKENFRKLCKWYLFCELHNEKTFFSIMDERNSVFYLFLPWNYLQQHWAIWVRLNFIWASLYF